MPKRFVFSPVPKQSRQPARWRWLAACTVSMLLSAMVHAQEAARCAASAASLDSLEGRVQWQGAGQSQWRDAHLHQTFCYGDTLLVQEKRAALRLSNNTLVRLNENSSLKLVPPEQSFWVELIAGAAHILTRTPKSFNVKAPYVNAAVEGTEFLVSAQSGINRVGVIEGVVRSSNAAGSVLLTQGQSTQTASSGEAPSAPVLLKLNDFVSWAMYFPPLPGRTNLPADLKAHLEKGEDGQVIQHISDNNQSSAEMLSLAAALALNRGQLAQAEQLNQRALTLNPKHPDAQSIAALIELGRGQLEPAKQRAAQNILDNPFNATAIIAHSYTQQAEGRLQAALDSALEAQRLTPNDSQIIARVAELYLSLGQRKPAEEALDKALTQAPNHSRLLTFKGFSLLAQRKAKAAQAYFVKASDLNSADPYAQLGWGMALIQRGKLEQGREHLELAVLLDPANSVLRSYLGKGYFEEDKLKLADTQLNLAKTLDANDPTPWYYLSQVKHEQHKYGEALELIETSIEKNANRAVYRDDGAIDSDAAARIADKARIYQAMGAGQLAIATASDAIRAEPNDYAGHRAMAMALTGKEGSQTARANEALQAGLLAPVGSTPLAPGVGETAMLVLPGAGPQEMGINEYNSSFSTNGVKGFVSALTAGNDTQATQGQIQLVGNKIDLALGQYHYSSDGFKANNDRDYLVYDALLKYQFFDDLKVLLSAGKRNDDLGDLSKAFREVAGAPMLRKRGEKDSYSLGFVYSLQNEFNLVALRSEKQENINSNTRRILPSGTVITVDSQFSAEPIISEISTNYETGYGRLVAGYKEVDYHTDDYLVQSAEVRGRVVQSQTINSARDEFSRQLYLDYSYVSQNDWGMDVGLENNAYKDRIENSREEYYRGRLDIYCGLGIRCEFSHNEFLSLPLASRDSIRKLYLSSFSNKMDYLPYSQITSDDLQLSFGMYHWDIIAGYGETKIETPQVLDGRGGLLHRPDFDENDFGVEVAGSIGLLDSLVVGYHEIESEAIRRASGQSSGDIPVRFDTQKFNMSIEEGFGEWSSMMLSVVSIQQEFVLEVGANDTFAEKKVSFVNVDASFEYYPFRNLSCSVSVFNLLDNRKIYMDSALANSLGESVGGVDSYVTERIISVSATLTF